MIRITRNLQYQNGFKRVSGEELEILSIMSGTEEKPITVGTGPGINFENPYITENQVQNIYNRLVGVRYLPCEVKWRGNPAVEAGDMVEVEDENGIFHKALVCDQTLDITGGCYSIIKCIGKTDTAIQFDNVSPTERKIKQAYTSLQEAIAEASALINGAKGGIYRVTDSNGDGINDGWLLSETDEISPTTKCIVGNYEGIGLSQDGGRTYENAITHNGLNASAITTGALNADLITVGTLNANLIKSGAIESLNGITSIDMDSGKIKVIDNPDAWNSTAFKIVSYNEMLKNTQSARGINVTNGASSYEMTSTFGFSGANDNHSMSLNADELSVYQVLANIFTQVSLESQKKNFKLSSNALDKIKNSEIYTYNYKFENDTDKKHYGFVIPDMGGNFKTPTEIISQNGDGIDTYSMCSILWKAVQELTEKVEKLETEKTEVKQ